MLLRNIEWSVWYTELVAELDELDALLAATAHNNNSAQNGKYILHINSIYLSYFVVYLDSVCIFRY